MSDTANPFGSELVRAIPTTSGLVSIEQQRAIAEVQARMIIARSNPRDSIRCMDHILQDCTRPTLAKGALYQYARGGTDISGPSIRLAEAIARRWGNIASGIKELSRERGFSECVAYAWDLETGYYDERQFQVKHWRDTKKGGYVLTDERDIYELIANMGQRRKRAVLLTVIPGDVVEAAVEQCEKTITAHADTSPEALQQMLAAFVKLGVTKEQIEVRIQRRIESIRPAQVLQLSNIYASINDGMSEPGDWFEGTVPAPTREQFSQAAPVDQSASQQNPKAPASGQQQPTRQRQQTPRQTRTAAPTSDQEQEHPAAQQPDTAHKPPADQEQSRGEQQQAATQAPQDAQDEGAAFEYYLLDEGGDPIGDATYTNPAFWADAFMAQWIKSHNRIGLVEQNADAIEDARVQSQEALKLLADLDEPEVDEAADAAHGTEAPEIPVIHAPVDRSGTPNYATWVREMKEAVGQTTEASFYDWVAAQKPEIDKAPQASRMLAIKAIAERAVALNLQPPAGFQPIPQEDKDERIVQAIEEGFASQTSEHGVKLYSNQTTTTAPLKRFEQEGKDALVQRIRDAATKRIAALKGA